MRRYASRSLLRRARTNRIASLASQHSKPVAREPRKSSSTLMGNSQKRRVAVASCGCGGPLGIATHPDAWSCRVARSVVGQEEPRLGTAVTRGPAVTGPGLTTIQTIYVGRGGHGSGRRDGDKQEIHGGGDGEEGRSSQVVPSRAWRQGKGWQREALGVR